MTDLCESWQIPWGSKESWFIRIGLTNPSGLCQILVCLEGFCRSWQILEGSERSWWNRQRSFKTLPDPFVTSRIHQDPPKPISKPPDQSVPSRISHDQQELPGNKVSIRTHQNPLGPYIIHKEQNIEIFIKNVTFNLKLSSCFISYLGQILTSGKFFWQFPTEN